MTSRPGFWMDETSGMLRPAIEAFLHDRPMTDDQVAAMRAYLRQWIEADDWHEGLALDNLRASIDRLTSREAISQWLALAEQIGIDPL
jgi:hypothetical protein